MTRPYRVSIITAVLNNRVGLVQMLGQLSAQSYPAIQLIVIDGGSTDGSVEVLQAHSAQIDYWISAPDSGIAAAMNKGLAQADGDLILFLHSDDRFADPDGLAQALRHVDNLETIWAFEVLLGEGASGRHLRPRPFNVWTRYKNPLPHQGVLCPRWVFTKIGGFAESYRIDMDYDLWLRAYLARIPLRRVPQVLAVMGAEGISSQTDWATLRRRFAEERRIHRAHARFPGWLWRYTWYWPSYLAYRWLRECLRPK